MEDLKQNAWAVEKKCQLKKEFVKYNIKKSIMLEGKYLGFLMGRTIKKAEIISIKEIP